MASNPLLNSLGSYAAWDPLRAAAQRRTSVNPTRVSMMRPGGPQALQRAPYTATQPALAPQPAQQPTQQTNPAPGYGIRSPDVPPAQQPTRQSQLTEDQIQKLKDYRGGLTPEQTLGFDSNGNVVPVMSPMFGGPPAGTIAPAAPAQPAMTTGWWQGYGTPFGNSSGAGYLQQMIRSGNLNPALTQGITR